MNSKKLTDTLNRPLHDLRISVIDRCNFRCPYCMPEKDSTHRYTFLKQQEWLSFEEIILLVKLFIQLGTKKVRLTGGEPLLRPNLTNLIQKLAKLKEIEDLALTTNGALLAQHAPGLRKAGLNRLTVSLDTLDPQVFKTMTGHKGSLSEVLSGIKIAEKVGFESIKINVVIERGKNDHTILDLVDYFRTTKHVLRFIEYMDVGNCNHWQSRQVVTTAEIVDLLKNRYSLISLPPNYFGEVALRYQIKEGGGEIGFISSISKPFCHSCTRARISADGKFFTCLFASQGTDLKTPLRSGSSDGELSKLIQITWQKREDRYSELRSQFLAAHQIPPKVEMFKIGG